MVASLLLGRRPAPLRRVPEMAERERRRKLKWLAEWTTGIPSGRGALAGGCWARSRRPSGLIDRLTENVSIPQARRALWWLALIADEVPEAAEAYLQAGRPPRDVAVPGGLLAWWETVWRSRWPRLVAARRWTAAELAAMDSPAPPSAVRSVLAAKSKGLTGPASATI